MLDSPFIDVQMGVLEAIVESDVRCVGAPFYSSARQHSNYDSIAPN